MVSRFEDMEDLAEIQPALTWRFGTAVTKVGIRSQ